MVALKAFSGVVQQRLVLKPSAANASPMTTMDGRDGLGSHDHVEADADNSDDSLESLFEDSTDPRYFALLLQGGLEITIAAVAQGLFPFVLRVRD